MSRYDNRNLNRILQEFIKDEHSENENYALEKYEEALSRVKAVHVINNLRFSGVADNIWYIGVKVYELLIRRHAFRYMSNLRSLRLHYLTLDDSKSRTTFSAQVPF